MKRLRGLCIGAGYFSQFHLDAWSRLPDVEIVGLCDVNREQAQNRAKEFRIPRVFSSAEQALTELKPDFVDIVTRPETHLALVQATVGNGAAIICQKPLAPDLAAATEIIDTAEQAGVPLMVHENFRFQPWYREIKQLLQQRVIGSRLHSLSFRSRPGDGWGPDAYLARQPYFREMPRLLIYETGVHFIDTFRYLAGEIEEVYAILRRLNPVIQGEDAALLTFRFADGAVGLWDANRYNEGTAGDTRLTFGQLLIEGDGGSLRLAEDGGITIQPLGESERPHDYQFERRGFAGDCVYQTQRHFLEQLRTACQFETSGRDYLRTLAVQEAVYRSANENRPLRPAERPD
jgi:predicted dehydrogenase